MIEVKFSFNTVAEAQKFLDGLTGTDATLRETGNAAVAERSAAAYLSDKGKEQADALGKQPVTSVPATATAKRTSPTPTAASAKPAVTSSKTLSPVEKARAEAERIKAQATASAAGKPPATAAVQTTSPRTPAAAPSAAASLPVRTATPTATAASLKVPAKKKFGLIQMVDVGGFPICWPPALVETEFESPETFAEWSTARDAAIDKMAAACPNAWQAIVDNNIEVMKKGITAMATQAATDNNDEVKGWLAAVKELLNVKVFREATDEQVADMALIFMLSIDGYDGFFQ